MAFDLANSALARTEMAALARWGALSANGGISRASVDVASGLWAAETVARSRAGAFLELCRVNVHL